jgi:hypothetical protein
LVSFAGSLLVGSLFSRFCLGGCLLGFCSGFSGALRFLFNKNLLIKKKKKTLAQGRRDISHQFLHKNASNFTTFTLNDNTTQVEE